MKTYTKTKTTLQARRALAGLTLAASAWCAGGPVWAGAANGGTPAAAQANDGSDYIAAWSVMGEICEVKYPQMKPAIDEFWTKRWNKETRERVAKMKQSADFEAKVSKHRKNLTERKEEILAQCDKLFMGGAH